jgi:hypothetical protein
MQGQSLAIGFVPFDHSVVKGGKGLDADDIANAIDIDNARNVLSQTPGGAILGLHLGFCLSNEPAGEETGSGRFWGFGSAGAAGAGR